MSGNWKIAQGSIYTWRENFHKCQENSRDYRREKRKQEKEEKNEAFAWLFHASTL